MKIKIVNYEQYNPRKDRARHYWFKVENSIIYSESLDDLEADQKWFWIFLLAYAKEKQADTFDLKMKYFVKHSGVSEKQILKALEILSANNTIELLQVEETSEPVNGAVKEPFSDGLTPNVPKWVPTLEKNRIEKNTEEERREDSQNSAKEIFDLWNENRGALPKAERLSDGRRKKAKVQLEKYPDPSHWRDAIQKFATSEFCVNEWKPGFDDLLDENKRIKALEGKYDRKLKAVTAPKTREEQIMEHNRAQYEAVLKGEL